jgi:hypothetical protein
MIPREPPRWEGGAYAEKLVFEALRDDLCQETFVYHRFSFVEEEHAREKEIDFLIVHRKKGLLALECKGAGVRRGGDGSWERVFGDGYRQPLKKSPFAQARDAVHALVRKLEDELADGFPRLTGLPFVYGHAVVFPRALRKEMALPQDVSHHLVYDASDLERIGSRVEDTMAFWAKAATSRRPELTKPEFKKFRRRILHPNLEIVPCLGASIQAGNLAFVKLTREQRHVVRGVLANPRMKVCGGAGTGKTVLAIEAARMLAERGERVLLVCFNRALGDHLKAAVTGEADSGGPQRTRDAEHTGDAQRTSGRSGRIHATTFHRLCARAQRLINGAGLDVPKDKEEAARFWLEEAPLVLLEALGSGLMETYDAVVVDEGQDFASAWWEALEECLGEPGRRGSRRRMVAFYDPSQTIFERQAELPDFPVFTLTRNFRNTRQIARVVQALGDVEMEPAERCPEGPVPDVRREPSAPKLKRQVGELLRHLVNKEKVTTEQIVILTPHSRKNSFLRDEESIGGFPLATTLEERRKVTGSVLHTTISAFKGLESDVVILVHIDPEDPRCSRNARYVATSRARHVLHVYGRQDPHAPNHPPPPE